MNIAAIQKNGQVIFPDKKSFSIKLVKSVQYVNISIIITVNQFKLT